MTAPADTIDLAAAASVLPAMLRLAGLRPTRVTRTGVGLDIHVPSVDEAIRLSWAAGLHPTEREFGCDWGTGRDRRRWWQRLDVLGIATGWVTHVPTTDVRGLMDCLRVAEGIREGEDPNGWEIAITRIGPIWTAKAYRGGITVAEGWALTGDRAWWRVALDLADFRRIGNALAPGCGL